MELKEAHTLEHTLNEWQDCFKGLLLLMKLQIHMVYDWFS